MDDVSIAKDCIDRMDEVFADDPESIDYDLVNNDEDREGEVAYEERVVLEPSEQEARRALRPSNTSKRLSPAGLLDDREDSADEEVVDGEEEINQEGLQRCIGALKSFFLRRLEDCILSLGGSTEVVKGIKIQVSRISTGVTQGLLEVSYYFNRSKRFRTRVEVACSLGLMVSVKSVRGMTREQHYRIATETREKHLISQQLSLANYVCEEIQYSDNEIKLCLKSDAAVCTEAVMETSPSPLRTEASDRSSLYFAFGNVVVLNWGTICHYPCFHSQHQIYPIGFKCLRQELDITLDRVVDCVCEIIAVYEGSDGQTSPVSLASIQANEYPSRDLLPLFRLSIAWQIPTVTSTGCMERTVVRVYEARTPQSAWQAAMLETVGLESLNMNMSYDAAIEDKYDAIEDQSEVMPPFETGDDEELEMRQKIRELRRKYFRMLRAEQSAGTQSAMKPRLNVDSSDGFFEDIVMRLIEGMDESIRCRNYAYCDTRDKGAGRKNMLKGYTKIYQKAKTLDKAIRRHAYVQEQLQLSSSCKRKKGADGSCDYSDPNSNNNNNRTNKRTKLDPKDRTKDMRFMVASALKSRTVRIKDMEKNINLMKFALAKYVKRRREDAKTLAEIAADREESHRSNRNKVSLQQPAGALMDSKAFGPNGGRPESIANFVVIDGTVMGQLMEIWEFLHAFSKKLQLSSDVPSIEQLMLAARTCDPRYRAVSSYTGSIHHTYDFVVAHQFVDPLPSDASDLLDRIGVALTSQLMPDFERLLGLDSIGAQGSMLQKVPNNTLTWREIARTVLLTTCCKEVGVSEVDAVSLLRGRGFFTSPETADRKTLKLARRRIKLNYALRNEHQESVIGFSSGLCVHIPAPGMPYPEEGVLWSQLVGSLDQVPDSCGWLVFEIIKAAAFSACVIDTSASAKRLKRSLLSCLAHPSFRVNDGAAAKSAAMLILSEHGQSQASTRKPSNSLSSQANSMDHGLVAAHAHTQDPHRAVLDQIKLVYDGSPYMIPLSTMDVWRKQLREAVRHAAVQEVVSAASTDMEGVGVVRVEDGDVSSVVLTSVAATTTERSVQSMDGDAVQAEKLSVAMQRCYVVVRDLMTNPQSNAFLWPVDGSQFPEYYRSVPQPLSLSEVRTALVEGLYRDSIFRFYCDVTLVIENAMAFNVENSAVKTAAQKFLLLFERLFFETVLCWDHALPSHDSCHGCRSVIPIEGSSKIAVCDRCDACYHLGCLEPPMFSPPRSEWYCLPCVEQKGIASAHPYRTADVSHPEDPAAKGEVVGIEQIRQTLMFVVEFGGVRELWDGRKIRQFAMEPPAMTGMEGEDRDGADGVCASESVFSMPTGYEYEDFDRVCGIARAYVGWGASHYLMPSVLMSEHNIAARTKSQDDSLFCQYRQSIATLGPSAGGVQGGELSMHEWGHLLTSLVCRILDATSLTAPLSEMDDKVDDDLVAQIQHGVQTDALPVERVFAMIRGESVAWRNDDNGDDDDDDVDKDILLGSSSKKKPLRAAVDPSAGTMGASKRTTGASCSVADEELDDDAGSDDEDMQQESDQEEEFDVDMKTVQLADSEEEEELELFDDEGRCLTSSLPTREQQTSPAAFSERSSQEGCLFRPIQPTSKTSLADIIASPTSMKRRDVEKEWVQRLLSRQKGREDAHLTQLLVLDILTQLDVDGRKELEEEVFRYVGDEELGGDFYSAALGGIVKGCVNKSGDTISAADWYVAWEANLTALQQNANDSITCQICGYDENYVANPFVWGQTAQEWEADLLSNNAHAVITEPQLTGADPSVFPLAQGVSVSVGIKGFKARYRVMKGLVWLPYNEQDAVIERHESDAMHRTIRSGSLLMHECCANFMHFNRQLNTERSRRNEDLRMTEILSGLGRGKSTPIGMDRDGSFYWVFKDCRALYVSTGGVSTLKSNASSACSPTSSFDSGCSPKWSVYRREIDIGRVVNWLVDAVPEERLLKRILQLLFPNSCCCSEDPQPPRQVQLFSNSIIDSSQRSNKSNSTTRSLESTGSAVGNVLELLRPDVSMRPAVVHRSRLLDLHYPSPSNETKLSGAPFKYRKGERILVDATPSNHILWDARVLETSIAKYDEDHRIRYYKVRFDSWGPAYDGWFEESQIVPAAGSVTGFAKQKVLTKTIQAESRQQYLQEHVWSAPPTLQSLNAYRFMGEPGRANSYRPPLSFSDSKGMVSQLRLALLIVEAALPHGSIDDSDDRWGEDFVTPWRAAVTVANDAVSLMQCQIMLEFGIRTAWLRPAGLKMLSCLASRTHAMRTATCGMVAIRIWTLDAAIKYDKLAATNLSQLSLASNPSDGKGSKPTHAKRK